MEQVSCLICRRRKIKCDRTPGSCHRCRKFGEQCVYTTTMATGIPNSPVGSSDGTTQAGLKRRRILLSCVACKRAKTRCSGDPQCDRCRHKHLDCVYTNRNPSGVRKEGPHRKLFSYSQCMPTWRSARNLPSIDRVRELVDLYFARIHTVRCMGFVHIPSFMERPKDPDELHSEDSGLIYIICALAAPFYYVQIMGHGGELHHRVRLFDAGKGWAAVPMQRIFARFGDPGVESLMTHILLHEYHLRVGDYAQAFLLSGIIARHTQVLQLNIEDDYDVLCRNNKISGAVKESRRRMVWTCYLLDAFIECGIDQLRFISSDDIQVQLPCAEDLFIRNVPCITEMLPRGKLLPFLDPSLATRATESLDLRAFYIRIMVIRSKILRYVKHLEGEIPWEINDDSQFHQLDNELRELEGSIPESLKICSENTYLFKASGRLNLYFGLHILISQTLVFPNSATQWIRENAPQEFIRLCRRMCGSKAIYIGSLLKDLWHCHKPSIVDIPYVMHTQICSSVLATSLTSWPESEPLLPEISHEQYQEILQNNVRILQYLQRHIKADMYYESANQALKRFHQVFSEPPTLVEVSASDQAKHPSHSHNYNPPQFSPEYILNPLGTYPMARKQVDDPHQPEINQPDISSVSESVDGYHSGSTQTDTDELSNPGEVFLCQISDWELEAPIMDSMGYPTFLDFPIQAGTGT